MCCGCCGVRGTSLQRRDLSEGKLQSSPMVARRAESCGHSGRSGLEAEGWVRLLLGAPARGGVWERKWPARVFLYLPSP